MPGRFELKPTLARIWHAPDNVRIMDPLPPGHRRGIIFAAALIVIGFLLPGTDDSDVSSSTRDAQLDLQSQSQPQSQQTAQPEQPPLVSSPQNDGQVAPIAPEPIQEQEQEQPPTTQNSAPLQEPTGIEQQWRTYRVEPGKTLAQLFRDHNLPPTDVYAMAQVEGNGKPLSNLQTGQIVKIRQNANGVVTGLTIEASGDQQVLFTRQTDGSFIRAR
ncbi:LysM-like peptidoglycan-binding domain-containing protein [Enterobacter sp. SA187]|jgi:cell envelope opacity-associated protein A|uniref:LysM-like peptidoglycan-binding domain-containing protein n=1 Tax=Enterobacter sp. SA187 TaxID=1914861 RepID=UPI0009339C25|nr:LysM-like peptidoglycan-binding domain-containing protein [Enterobacter sp. SA187]